MVAGASEEGDARRCVGFVGFEVEEETDAGDGDEAREVDVEMVGLGAVGSVDRPESACHALSYILLYRGGLLEHLLPE